MTDKQKVFTLLEDKKYDFLLSLFDLNPNLVRKYVTMATYSITNNLAKNAIEFFGYLTKKRANSKPEYFREIIKRHIWGMNEEGANIDWAAPEIIGAIVAAEPDLYGEFASIMIMAAIEEPIFQKGMFFAIEMLGPENSGLIEDYLPKLREFTLSKDIELAKLSCRVLSHVFPQEG